MSYAGTRQIFDADSHLMELPDFLSAHADGKIREQLPSLTEQLTGQFDPYFRVDGDGRRPKATQSSGCSSRSNCR